MCKGCRSGFFLIIAVFGLFVVRGQGSTIAFQFNASLQTGSLAGTQLNGAGSYDDAGATGSGKEFLQLTSLNFSLLGNAFTLADVGQGGQAILQDGTLSYFTAAFFPQSPPSPVNDIAFGFGGPGVIGYSTPPGFNFGEGEYTLAMAPEPSTLALTVTAFGLLLWFRLRGKDQLLRNSCAFLGCCRDTRTLQSPSEHL